MRRSKVELLHFSSLARCNTVNTTSTPLLLFCIRNNQSFSFWKCLILSIGGFHSCLQEVARKHGLLLVDTKYEFGKTSDGTIVLIDEVKCLCTAVMILSVSVNQGFASLAVCLVISSDFYLLLSVLDVLICLFSLLVCSYTTTLVVLRWYCYRHFGLCHQFHLSITHGRLSFAFFRWLTN